MLGGPLCRGVFGHVARHDASVRVRQHEKDKGHAEGGGWHGKKITRHDIPTWLCRKAFHVGDDGLRLFGRYFSTVDLEASSLLDLESQFVLNCTSPQRMVAGNHHAIGVADLNVMEGSLKSAATSTRPKLAVCRFPKRGSFLLNP